MTARTLQYLNHPDYSAGRAAEQAGESWKRWQTAPWRAGWGRARSERREREFQTHEAALDSADGCQDPACPWPSCARAEPSQTDAEAYLDRETFASLVSDGQSLRHQFDATTRGMKVLTADDLGRTSRAAP